MKHLKLAALCVLPLTILSCSDPAGPTGKVFDLKDGAVAIELRGWGDESIGVDTSSIREFQGKHLATWFTYRNSKATSYFTTEFDCKTRLFRVLQAGDENGRLLPHEDSTHQVLPKSNEEVVMDYLC